MQREKDTKHRKRTKKKWIEMNTVVRRKCVLACVCMYVCVLSPYARKSSLAFKQFGHATITCIIHLYYCNAFRASVCECVIHKHRKWKSQIERREWESRIYTLAANKQTHTRMPCQLASSRISLVCSAHEHSSISFFFIFVCFIFISFRFCV